MTLRTTFVECIKSLVGATTAYAKSIGHGTCAFELGFAQSVVANPTTGRVDINLFVGEAVPKTNAKGKRSKRDKVMHSLPLRDPTTGGGRCFLGIYVQLGANTVSDGSDDWFLDINAEVGPVRFVAASDTSVAGVRAHMVRRQTLTRSTTLVPNFDPEDRHLIVPRNQAATVVVVTAAAASADASAAAAAARPMSPPPPRLPAGEHPGGRRVMRRRVAAAAPPQVTQAPAGSPSPPPTQAVASPGSQRSASPTKRSRVPDGDASLGGEAALAKRQRALTAAEVSAPPPVLPHPGLQALVDAASAGDAYEATMNAALTDAELESLVDSLGAEAADCPDFLDRVLSDE